LSENAAKNAKKPTHARSTAIALEPSRILGVCISSRSSFCSRSSAGALSRVRGICTARIVATTKTTAAKRNDQSAPKSL
jgi:hypothetical protein